MIIDDVACFKSAASVEVAQYSMSVAIGIQGFRMHWVYSQTCKLLIRMVCMLVAERQKESARERNIERN